MQQQQTHKRVKFNASKQSNNPITNDLDDSKRWMVLDGSSFVIKWKIELFNLLLEIQSFDCE
ncbi:hypothetical protein QR98_0065140 [Sarcoptes scabiei]|uniref:Uncharacterized protein n=1 Tax=Sarcoptes scabiei TaxID=52283 RepID=A0A132AAI1_SARSC|nr:hypothetical protein QR98_0065140 [Sarcoptes scabiei]